MNDPYQNRLTQQLRSTLHQQVDAYRKLNPERNTDLEYPLKTSAERFREYQRYERGQSLGAAIAFLLLGAGAILWMFL